MVIGADSSATLVSGAHPTIEQKVKKVQITDDHVIVAGTGQAGLGQRFNAVVSAAWHDKKFKEFSSSIELGKFLAARAIEDCQATKMPPGHYGALVAFPFNKQAHLCEFVMTDFQPELKTNDSLWYVSMGSGQAITDPFLGFMRRVFWEDGIPSSQDGVFAVTWALQHAIEMNPGGINEPIQIAILAASGGGEKLSARLLSESELAEHRNNVEGAIHHLKNYADVLRGDTPTSQSLPKTPRSS